MARLADLTIVLARQIDARPIWSLGMATGLGFLLGGALSSRAGRIALAMAARHAARQLL